MPDLVGLAFFPGVQAVISASYTFSHGITPGVALLTIAPQASFPTLVGALVFTFAGVRLVFPDMKMDKTSFKYDQAGLVWQVSLLDRRWKWRFNEVRGRFNVREPDHAGEILSDSEATPIDLAQILLGPLGLGEVDYDVSGLPAAPRPEIEWQIDNPAKVLADLAEQFGCRVVLDLANRVRILPIGTGATLPAGGLMAGSATVDPPERPDALAVICGPTLYQIDVLLEAVGEDRSGEIVPINELSYKPGDGWEKTHPLGPAAFLDVGDPTKPHDRDRELAKKSVYRMYRITLKDPFGDGQEKIRIPLSALQADEEVSGDQPLETYRQLLPLDDRQTEIVGWAGPDGILRTSRKSALVWGTFYFGGPPGTSKINTQEPDPGRPVPPPGPERGPNPNHYLKSFSIDGNRGLVLFGEPVFWWDKTNKRYKPAKLALRTAAVVRRVPGVFESAMSPYRYERGYSYPPPYLGGGRLRRPLRHDELVLRVNPEYSPGTGEPIEGSFFNNKEDINPEADYYLAATQLEYQQTFPEERVYMGLLPISPDGAIQQVTWSVGPQGATTQASRNTEHALWVPPYKERRFLELLHSGRQLDLEEAAKRLRRIEWFKRLDNA